VLLAFFFFFKDLAEVPLPVNFGVLDLVLTPRSFCFGVAGIVNILISWFVSRTPFNCGYFFACDYWSKVFGLIVICGLALTFDLV